MPVFVWSGVVLLLLRGSLVVADWNEGDDEPGRILKFTSLFTTKNIRT